MEYHWVLPPTGTVKINVHGAIPFIPFHNGNPHSLGMITRNAEGELIKLSTGILPSTKTLENKMNAILQGLKKGFEGKFKRIIVETDNLDAFKVIKNYPHGVLSEVADVAKQIFIRLNDKRWYYVIAYIFSERNQLTIYLAHMGGEKCNNIFIFPAYGSSGRTDESRLGVWPHSPPVLGKRSRQ